jgi:[ribosomal protein S5]-alanine N-acetyltransferase
MVPGRGRAVTLGWPVELRDGDVLLRPIRMRDRVEWRELRARNGDWLRPWDATSPAGPGDMPPSFGYMVRTLLSEGRAGRLMPFVIAYHERLAGQVTVGGITWGSLRSAHIGYWVDQRVAGRGIVPTAVAMASDHLFAIGLHRVEINIRPENAASLRVVEKLGFRREGDRLRFLHIDGAWRDHLCFALTAEEVGDGLLNRWRASRPGTYSGGDATAPGGSFG